MAKIIKEYPPNYQRIKQVFNPPENVIYCYGDKIYNPSDAKIEDHLLIHEGVHEKQQKFIGVEAWWERYLTDKDFRLEQELEAYATQYNFIKSKTTEKIYSQFLDMFAKHLSTIYKLDISKNKAQVLIRKKAQSIA